MKMTLSITYKLLLSIAFTINLIGLKSMAADLKFGDFTIPHEYVIDGKKLVLNGASYRKVGFIRVKVWLSALYLEEKSDKADEIVKSPETKVIVLHPLYDVSAADSVKGWRLSLDQKCDEACKKLAPDVQKFLDSVPEFKIKDRYVYFFTGKGMSYSVNDKLLFKTENKELSQLVLSTWIGSRQDNKDVEKNLLGRSAP